MVCVEKAQLSRCKENRNRNTIVALIEPWYNAKNRNLRRVSCLKGCHLSPLMTDLLGYLCCSLAGAVLDH